MTILTLSVTSKEEINQRFIGAFIGAPQGARIGFATPQLLWAVLSAKRWQILQAMAGAGPLSVRETARRVKRDVKAVHGDVTALIKAGLLERTDSHQILFPYDGIKVEFELRAA